MAVLAIIVKQADGKVGGVYSVASGSTSHTDTGLHSVYRSALRATSLRLPNDVLVRRPESCGRFLEFGGVIIYQPKMEQIDK